jgi:anti-sigma factor ChrR (cupin superfamily)
MSIDYMDAGGHDADDESEAEIARLGALMQRAYAEGNRETAEQYLQAQRVEICARSQQQIQTMEARLGLADRDSASCGAGDIAVTLAAVLA